MYCVSDRLELCINVSQLQRHTLMFRQPLYVPPGMTAGTYRAPSTLPISGLISLLLWFYSLKSHYFIWQISAANSCSLLHRIIAATVCRLPTRAADWQREMTDASCKVKCECNPYTIRALASVSRLCSHIISLPFLYLNFFSAFFLSSNIIVCVRLSSVSAQLSYHLRPDLLSTLFLSTLRPISGANRKPKSVSLFVLQYKYHTALFCILFR